MTNMSGTMGYFSLNYVLCPHDIHKPPTRPLSSHTLHPQDLPSCQFCLSCANLAQENTHTHKHICPPWKPKPTKKPKCVILHLFIYIVSEVHLQISNIVLLIELF
jgi:hypothetical protein